MRELELRLALVCYGGASLAVYMNGITAEILNLVRASRNVHARKPDKRDAATKAAGSTAVYQEILHAFAPKVRVRVIVDVVSGASAGGINGIMLSRALAHDLDFQPLKTMWMELADVEELMDSKTIAGGWSKLYMVPLMKLFGGGILGAVAKKDPEIRRKLMRFVRSRWFKPPFSGDIMLGWMLEAARDLGVSKTSTSSLMPRGHKLDLFVSVTNFYGQREIMTLHDPKTISEPRHAQTLHFSHKRGFGPATEQHAMADDNIPALGFAARATSSFPGAFPSVSFSDLEDKIHQLNMRWAARGKFLRKNYPGDYKNYATLKRMSFIDGGVTNNKPFSAAIKAIAQKPAFRQVDRRLIFVDPFPETEISRQDHMEESPGFLKTIFAAMTSIPRAEPIYNDVQALEQHNTAVRRTKQLLTAIARDAHTYASQFIKINKRRMIDAATLASWREQSHESAHKMAGISYPPYVEVKISYTLDLLAGLGVRLFKSNKGEMEKRISQWASASGITALGSPIEAEQNSVTMQARINFFRQFDVTFRLRRLHYVIRELNTVMQQRDWGGDEQSLQQIKRVCYDHVSQLNLIMTYDSYDGLAYSENDSMAEAMSEISRRASLEDIDLSLDDSLAAAINKLHDDSLKQTVLQAYIGFTFFDVLALPHYQNFTHFDQSEVKVNRISPQDNRTLLGHDFIGPLMGTELYNFGAFFSRRARENDFLWGRIHAANRLFDFLINATDPFDASAEMDTTEMRRKLLLAVLAEEKEQLSTVQDIISDLQEKWGLSAETMAKKTEDKQESDSASESAPEAKPKPKSKT